MPLTTMPDESELIYDWNVRKRRHKLAHKPIILMDETLRDGLQGPSVVDPHSEDKKRILELADELGIHCVNLGLPGAGPRAYGHVLELAKHVADKGLKVIPCCAARTMEADIRPIFEISQEAGIGIEVMSFLGTSPIRQYVEDWDTERLRKLAVAAIELAVKEGHPVSFVTEDTGRSRPTTLDPLFRAAIDAGAHRLCLCDTVGHATPDGVRNLIEFTQLLIESTGADVGIDWHGHNDRGLALTNTLRAVEYGADRVHGTALGIGERVGNAPLDLVMVNLKLLGEIDNDLSALRAWCETVSQAVRWEIPRNYPLMGTDAFRTATGVHAAAVIKAAKKGDTYLADRIYSGVPAGQFGLSQEIQIGPMSGHSNVEYWLSSRGYDVDMELTKMLLRTAKGSERVLTDREIEHLIERFQRQREED